MFSKMMMRKSNSRFKNWFCMQKVPQDCRKRCCRQPKSSKQRRLHPWLLRNLALGLEWTRSFGRCYHQDRSSWSIPSRSKRGRLVRTRFGLPRNQWRLVKESGRWWGRTWGRWWVGPWGRRSWEIWLGPQKIFKMNYRPLAWNRITPKENWKIAFVNNFRCA